jgi:hypothetical protein
MNRTFFSIYFLILIFLLQGSAIFSEEIENHWDSVVIEKKKGKARIFSENVNVREKSNPTSKVVTKLQPGDSIEILEKTKESFKINNQNDYWYKIKSKNKIGYIWGGLIADGQISLDSNLLLIRNLGVQEGKVELKLMEGNKTLSKLIMNSGPVGSESSFQFRKISTSGFSIPPKYLIGISLFIYSEIEYGLNQEFIIAIDAKGILRNQFSWYTTACDPPSCAENFLVLPGDLLQEDKKTKRKSIKGKKDTITLLTRSYDLDDPKSDSFSSIEYNWNGMDFIGQESP